MNQTKVSQNKERIQALMIEGKWKDASIELKKVLQEVEKADYQERFRYIDLENLLEYQNKPQNQWLIDIKNSNEYSDKELNRIVNTAIRGEYKEALKQIEDAVQYSPTNANLYHVMAIVYFYLKDLNKYFEIKDSKQYEDLYKLESTISGLIEDDGKFGQGIKIIDKHLETFPEDHLMLSYKGVALYKLGEIALATEFLKKSLASKQSRYAVAHVLEITKNTGNHAEALIFADQLISMLEEEIQDNNSKAIKEGEKTSVFDLWAFVHLSRIKLDRVNIFIQMGRTQDAQAALVELISYLDKIVYPKWLKASDDDPVYIVDAYQGGWDTPGIEIDKIYSTTTSLLSQIDPGYKKLTSGNNGSGCLSAFLVIVLVSGLLGVLIF